MWWAWDAAEDSGPMAGAYTARGLGGQYITVTPRLDMVVADKVDPRPDSDRTQPRRRITAAQYGVILMITGARWPGIRGNNPPTAVRVQRQATRRSSLKNANKTYS